AACVAGGIIAALTIRNPPRPAPAGQPDLGLHCALGAPPLRAAAPAGEPGGA
ncbi:MAG: hypothetical protein JWO98_2272, partial [Frankiales bacterium]|nr:hypothetical protein [Frankiales bacterium]